MQDVLIYAAIVTYNPDILLLKGQINALVNQVDCMVLIDNGSSNFDEVERHLNGEIDSKVSSVIIRNEQNMGLGYAQNQGARYAIQNGASHILIMDQDSVPDQGFVQALLEAERFLMEKSIKVGALGPVYYSEKTGEIYPITKFIGPFIKRIKPSSYPVEASFLISSGCLVRAETFVEVGMMNEGLFIDYIDVDWSFRAFEKGFKLFACPGARMRHSIGDKRASVFWRSVSVHSPLRRYYLCRNSIYMIGRSYIPIGYKIREITFNTLRLVVFMFLSEQKIRYFKYCLTGFYDGFRGVKGKCPRVF